MNLKLPCFPKMNFPEGIFLESLGGVLDLEHHLASCQMSSSIAFQFVEIKFGASFLGRVCFASDTVDGRNPAPADR